MRVRLVGNHSSYHCGSAAAWQSLRRLTRRKGWTIALPGTPYDALIVNGEGTMHRSRGWWQSNMGLLKDALDASKPAYLVNSVWEKNGSEHDDVLRRLTGIWVREKLSHDDLLERHGVQSHIAIDLSFFQEVRPGFFVKNFKGEPVMTDFFSQEFGVFAFPKRAGLAKVRRVGMRGSWGSFVSSLKTASLIATGRHHAVIAACKARVPFVAMEGNSHKITGLVRTAGVDIPIATALDQIPEIIAWAEANRSVYERLFDWMHAQDWEKALPSPPCVRT